MHTVPLILSCCSQVAVFLVQQRHPDCKGGSFSHLCWMWSSLGWVSLVPKFVFAHCAGKCCALQPQRKRERPQSWWQEKRRKSNEPSASRQPLYYQMTGLPLQHQERTWNWSVQLLRLHIQMGSKPNERERWRLFREGAISNSVAMISMMVILYFWF